MKKLAIDLEMYFRDKCGLRTYYAGFIPPLLRLAPELEVTFFASSEYAGELGRAPFGNAENVTYRPLRRRHRLNRLAFFTFGGWAVEGDIGPHDVYHAPTILGFGTRGAYVVTVHDLAWMYHKHIYPRWTIWARGVGLPWDLKRARRIITSSEATKKDLVELKGVDPDRVRVVHLGVSPEFTPDRDPEQIGRTIERLGIRTPYVVTLAGGHSPRKNLARLVRAMARVRRRLGPVQLVVLGHAIYDTSAFERAVDEEGLSQAVLRFGHTRESDLLDVLAGARAMVFPSLYEGFGFPILEAMASGTPVVTSNVSSMPEVACDAAILVDPTDEEAIADGIVRLLEDDGLYDELRRKGIDRASGFTWESCAGKMLKVYREAAASEPRGNSP